MLSCRKSVPMASSGLHDLKAVTSPPRKVWMRRSFSGQYGPGSHDSSNVMTKLAQYQPDVQRVEYVGPAIGKELRKQGVYSVFWAVLGIVVYVALRFDSRFVPGAIMKMIFDVSMVLAFYLFFQARST